MLAPVPAGQTISSTPVAEEAASPLLRAGQGRADLTRTSLGKHLCQLDDCKVSRDRNQPQRARLVLQALTQEEPLTASQGRRPLRSAAERVDPNPQPGKRKRTCGVFSAPNHGNHKLAELL